MEEKVITKSTGNVVSYHGGIVGQNFGTVSGNTSSATLTATGGITYFGGIVGLNGGTVSNNIAKDVTVSAPRYYGAVVGYTDDSKLENNFYTACTVNGVENATNVGVYGSDVTENYGAVGISFTEPAAVKDLVYNKLSHELVTAGKTNFGTLLYSLDGEKYSAEIPTATDAKTYTVYYKVEGSDNWNAFEAKKVEVEITGKSAAIGRANTRAVRITRVGADRTFDLKGRPVHGSSNARGAYYKK